MLLPLFHIDYANFPRLVSDDVMLHLDVLLLPVALLVGHFDYPFGASVMVMDWSSSSGAMNTYT